MLRTLIYAIYLASTILLVSSTHVPEIKPLPSLREQTRLQEEWRTERLARIPALLEKYGADAWLVCS